MSTSRHHYLNRHGQLPCVGEHQPTIPGNSRIVTGSDRLGVASC